MPSSEAYRIGVDLGGAKTEVVVLDPQDGVVFRERRGTPLVEGYHAVLNRVADLVRDGGCRVPAASGYTVGIGIPGSVDAASGLVRNANSVCLIGRPLQGDLERLLGRRIGVRNDADCFTLAECRKGAGAGYGLVFGVIMGTGCGGGICIDGVVREGPHRICGEWGHFALDPSGPPCYCGNRGCVETKISGSGMEAAFALRYGESLSMEEIVAGARLGEPRCATAFNAFLDDFGRSLGGSSPFSTPMRWCWAGGFPILTNFTSRGSSA